MILSHHPEIPENKRRSTGGAQRLPLTLDPRLSTLDFFIPGGNDATYVPN